MGSQYTYSKLYGINRTWMRHEFLINSSHLMLIPELWRGELLFHKLLEPLHPFIAKRPGTNRHFRVQSEAFPELVLEVLARPEALELAVDHDGDLGAERLALLHTVRCQHQRVAFHPDVRKMEHLKGVMSCLLACLPNGNTQGVPKVSVEIISKKNQKRREDEKRKRKIETKNEKGRERTKEKEKISSGRRQAMMKSTKIHSMVTFGTPRPCTFSEYWLSFESLHGSRLNVLNIGFMTQFPLRIQWVQERQSVSHGNPRTLRFRPRPKTLNCSVVS